ncbi:MAG: class I SAM-dependent methyltransferase [Acidimicrobiia bacterium]|nr:class I SAM-dependent methyltransferase [Acidimicrobiia bacterium]
MPDPYYRADLSLVHHRGFGFHADLCAPGILSLLEPVRANNGLVLELGCGSGLLTRHLVDAGHRVIASDASAAMLAIAADYAEGAEDFQRIVMPDDPLPSVDAVVATGHPMSYLSSRAAIERALIAAAGALNPGGLLAVDLCDLEWGRDRKDSPPHARVGKDWALFTEFATPSPDRFDRSMTTFLLSDDGTWRRDHEVHHNILVDTSTVPTLLADHGVEAEVKAAFGDETLPVGLKAVIGRRHA